MGYQRDPVSAEAGLLANFDPEQGRHYRGQTSHALERLSETEETRHGLGQRD
jgi:hypothetical protein